MFTQFTTLNAPEESKIMLQNVQEKFKFLPNQDRILAVAPNIYKAYNDCFDQFLSKSSLGLIAGQVVLMTVSHYNNSPYCMGVHSWGMEMTGVQPLIVEALRNNTTIPDQKLEALKVFTVLLIKNKGNMSDVEIQKFLGEGYTNQNIIEIIGGIATKTISNYINIIAKTELDPIMQKYKWSKPTK
jgi:alkylhydroperoxidase family enzyme